MANRLNQIKSGKDRQYYNLNKALAHFQRIMKWKIKSTHKRCVSILMMKKERKKHTWKIIYANAAGLCLPGASIRIDKRNKGNRPLICLIYMLKCISAMFCSIWNELRHMHKLIDYVHLFVVECACVMRVFVSTHDIVTVNTLTVLSGTWMGEATPKHQSSSSTRKSYTTLFLI